MQYINQYQSPIEKLVLAADDLGLTGLWFEGQKFFPQELEKTAIERNLPVFEQAKAWLDIYFSGKKPDFEIPIHFIGTPF